MKIVTVSKNKFSLFTRQNFLSKIKLIRKNNNYWNVNEWKKKNENYKNQNSKKKSFI